MDWSQITVFLPQMPFAYRASSFPFMDFLPFLNVCPLRKASNLPTLARAFAEKRVSQILIFQLDPLF